MNTKTIEQFSTMTADMLAGVEGGWGYRWRCTDGYTSAWHLLRDTAQENADNHMILYPGTVCRVYNA
ncbi:TPA: ComC/BlpC family leader-containing pheromone/bacteriocin [Streptococcus equi subsp. zooepidemicus]|uniref:Bacteriocin n=4 Tax=Streptococcus equi TaxID=1336 RepID=A0A6D2LFQ0_STRSZ|nr:ComC/BlpC family leader-containing pheromone/bacteriocin [Streptococcus equi]KIS17655.1 bacteriocin [Streptococcus equi subsp. zooepidemicus Sz4is]AIA67625.1 bacteriocin [Streptococcus equi subsp. zooepidemicus CY]ASB96727.1 bacteriocin [Streptococcus equi subsp. equi]KDE01952.1 bacteriocin [Streptococcus equi subsp. zooepidemicus SzS31A1]KIS05331.1 bacteriocin [Streptococcus equi subsp. zooepidemicus Sz12is]